MSSATSLYFVYDFCVHRSLNPLLSYFLRYLPLLTALSVFPVIWLIRLLASCCMFDNPVLFQIDFILIIRKCARKKWKLLRKHSFWWMIILLYSHVVHTSMSILNCPSVPDLSGHEAFVSSLSLNHTGLSPLKDCFNLS